MAVPYYGDYPVDHAGVVIPFNAFTSNDPSASATITDFANTDVHIHKNGSLTERASSSGVAIDIDVDAITGGHWITIDLSDNDDAGFYVAESEISVRIEGVTIDGATVNAFVGSFSIERAGGSLALLKLIQAAVITNAAGADIAADIIALKAETELIVADTGELQTDWHDGGRLDQLIDAIPTTAMRGTDNAALASVCTEARLAELAAANLPADVDTLLSRITAAVALASVCTEGRLAELDAANLPTDIAAIPTTAMRGTDNAALASVCTEGRLAELDAGNLPTDIAAIPTTAMRGTDNAALASVCTEGRLAELAAANLPADVDTLLTRITAAVALASICTEGRLAELDAGNLPTDIAAIPTAAQIKTALEAAGSDLDYLITALVNKMIVTEANGNTEQFTDTDVSLGSIAAAFSTDGTFTTRKRLVI